LFFRIYRRSAKIENYVEEAVSLQQLISLNCCTDGVCATQYIHIVPRNFIRVASLLKPFFDKNLMSTLDVWKRFQVSISHRVDSPTFAYSYKRLIATMFC